MNLNDYTVRTIVGKSARYTAGKGYAVMGPNNQPIGGFYQTRLEAEAAFIEALEPIFSEAT